MEFKRIVMSKKQTYRIRNWKQYNESLVQRGSLTFWIDEEAIQQWNLCERTGERGRPLLYSDTAIQCALLLRAVFRVRPDIDVAFFNNSHRIDLFCPKTVPSDLLCELMNVSLKRLSHHRLSSAFPNSKNVV